MGGEEVGLDAAEGFNPENPGVIVVMVPRNRPNLASTFKTGSSR